jgi:hypothetical protein
MKAIKPENFEKILFVDFENVQKIKLEKLDSRKSLILLFVGRNQNKIPFELVRDAQRFGDQLIWVKIEGAGKNNLDFHIAYELGVYNQNVARDVEFVVLSKDTGFDSLIRYINTRGRRCVRINSIIELTKNVKNTPTAESTRRVIENLTKINYNKRPRTRKTLIKHVESLLKTSKEKDRDAESIVDDLFIRELIKESSGKLKYNLG